jgi:outer membrane protein assembly factor BamB
MMKTILFALCMTLACLARAQDAIDDSELTTATDLLRGFSSEELVAAQRAIPSRREPPLGLARPRLIEATGHVYEDRNANGRREDNEPALPNVMVSDGERVSCTGDDGAYTFEIRMDENPHYRFVVATRPTGYKPTSDYFLRIPFAEDRTEYSADFGFVRDKASAKREFWFITASDSQFTKIEEMIPTAKDYAQVTSAPRSLTLGKPAFLATAGDLTMNGSQFEWDMYDHIRRSSKIPVYEGFGGHDGNCLDPRCTVNFEQRIGPPYYSWDHGGVHFIQIVTETGYLKPTARLRQSDWMQEDLKALPPKMPVIAVSHYPLDAAWFDQRKAEGIHVIAQIGAHWHVVMAGSRGGVPVLNSAPARGRDWGAYSRTYRWVFVSPEGVRSQLRVAGQYKRLRVVAPGPRAVPGRQPLVVLAYDTSLLVKSVTCRWLSPGGKMTTTPLKQQGDWSWHGEFVANKEGKWQCDLEAIDVTGALWKRTQTVDVRGQTRERSGETSHASELPYVLAGEPPRNIAKGPSPPLFPLWVTQTGSVHVLHNSPVVSDGKVFVSVGNPNAGAPGAGVLCLDAGTGKQIWKADSPHGDVRSPVSVHKNIVYAIAGEGWVAAYDAETGRSLWSKPMHPSYQDGRPLAINNTPPLPTRHGLVVSDWQKPQRLLDFATGKELSQLSGDVGYYASFATVFDNIMYSVRRGGGNAIHLPDGKEIYKFEEPARSTSAPIVVDGKLIYTRSGGISVREASTGKLIWRKGTVNAGYQNAIPVVWGDLVLVNGTNLQIFDLNTGETRKTVTCAQEADRFLRSRRQAMAGSSTPIVAGAYAFFGHDDTSIRAINRAGDVVWEHRLGTPIKTAPAAFGNKLFVHDYAGNLWCFAGSVSNTPGE